MDFVTKVIATYKPLSRTLNHMMLSTGSLLSVKEGQTGFEVVSPAGWEDQLFLRSVNSLPEITRR